MQSSVVKKNFLLIEKLQTILFLGFTHFDSIWIFSAYCGQQISSTFQSTDLFSSPIAFGHSLIMTFPFHLSFPNVSCYDLQQSHSHDWSNTKWTVSPMLKPYIVRYTHRCTRLFTFRSHILHEKLSKKNLKEKESSMCYSQMYWICMDARLLGNIKEWKMVKVLTRI